MQKVMNQRIDGDHAAADLPPMVIATRRRQQDARQGHFQDLVRNAVNVSQWANYSGLQPGSVVNVMGLSGAPEPGIKPVNQAAASDVTNKQKQRIGGLVQTTVA